MTWGTEVDIIATLTPKPGKLDRVVELLSNLTTAVKANEHGVTSFHLYEDFDAAHPDQRQLVLVEKYKDMEAYDAHAETPEFKAMHKIFKGEELMERPIIIKSVKPIRGFERA
ncbi:hypothetical protein EDC01DRAFT_635508 [Geopyxis carbonaria]|nr:hypothetical protein EDC01DRAFT_635508 [Geopyxis carbonaria]